MVNLFRGAGKTGVKEMDPAPEPLKSIGSQSREPGASEKRLPNIAFKAIHIF